MAAQHSSGEAEAPIILPDDANEYRTRMQALLKSERHDIVSASTARRAGLLAADLVACRHFRTPVAPFFWYQYLKLRDLISQIGNTVAETAPENPPAAQPDMHYK